MNNDKKRTSVVKVSVAKPINESLRRWYGHVERIADDRLVKVHDDEVKGTTKGKL